MGIIQVYVKKSDLIYSEPVEGYEDQVDRMKKTLLEEGMKNAIKIKADGYVCRGNTRAQASKDDYIPIDLGFFIGLFKTSSQWDGIEGPSITLRRDVFDEELHHMNTLPYPVKKPNNKDIPLVPAKLPYLDKSPEQANKQSYMIDYSDELVVFPASEYLKIGEKTFGKNERNKSKTQNL